MFPLMALPALVSGVGGVVKGIANATADHAQQKYNNQKLEELLGRQKNNTLGLSGQDKAAIGNPLQSAAARAAAEGRSRAEGLMAAGGRTSGADLQQGTQQQAANNAMGAQQAAAVVNAADRQQVARDKNEIEARFAEKSRMASRDVNQTADPMIQLAGAGGQAAADTLAPPVEQPFTPEQIQQLLKLLGPGAQGFSAGPPSLAAGFGR